LNITSGDGTNLKNWSNNQ